MLTTRRLSPGRRKTDRLGKIACPYCQGATSLVIDSRPNKRQDGIFRRRECQECNQRFSTEETIRGSYPTIRTPEETHHKT